MTTETHIEIDPLYDLLIGPMVERLQNEPDYTAAMSIEIQSDHRPIEDVLHDVRDYLVARDLIGYAPLVGIGKERGTIVIILMEIAL